MRGFGENNRIACRDYVRLKRVFFGSLPETEREPSLFGYLLSNPLQDLRQRLIFQDRNDV